MGFSNMHVFIAGATTRGFSLKFHARTMQVSRLSARPFEIFPSVFAESGAISIMFASFIRSMCNTGSDLWDQAYHSSASENHTRRGFSGSSRSWKSKFWVSVFDVKKCLAFSVATTTTFRSQFKSNDTSSAILIEATLPVQPRITDFL